MDGDDGLGILPTKGELEKKAEGKPAAAPVAAAAPEAKAKKSKKGSKALKDMPEPEPLTGTQMLVLKTQVGQERRVAEALGNKARRFGVPILGLLAPSEMRGFVFIETTDPIRAEKGVRGISYARSLIKDISTGQPRDVPFGEIAHFLTPVSAVAKIAEGDIVELVSGPFRGEKAKVTRVDDTKEEITVELIESMVPIPITVKGENVRVLQKSQ
jgi:transcriptional antiterminator NusG